MEIPEKDLNSRKLKKAESIAKKIKDDIEYKKIYGGRIEVSDVLSLEVKQAVDLANQQGVAQELCAILDSYDVTSFILNSQYNMKDGKLVEKTQEETNAWKTRFKEEYIYNYNQGVITKKGIVEKSLKQQEQEVSRMFFNGLKSPSRAVQVGSHIPTLVNKLLPKINENGLAKGFMSFVRKDGQWEIATKDFHIVRGELQPKVGTKFYDTVLKK